MTLLLKQLLIQPLRYKPCIECRRLLFNNNLLGIDNFMSNSNKYKQILGNRKEILIDRLQKNTKDKVQKDDLWQMLYIADTDRDVELCIQMTRRYSHFQKSIPRESVYKADLNFGTEIMRMLHHLRKSDIATMLVKDQDLKEFFMHFSTYLIYMDLLFECGKYDQVVEFYFKTMNRKDKENNLTTLFMAALYKMNTKDSLQKAVDFFHTKCHSEDDDFSHRTKAFAAVLALNQGEPELALEIIDLNFESSWKGHFNTSLRMLILCKLNRIEEALMILEDFVFVHEEREGRPRDSAQVFPDCVEAVQEVIDKCDCLELKQKFSKIKKELLDEGYIHKKTSIEMLNRVLLSSRADMAKIKEKNRKKERYQKYKNILS